ncbi:MAG: Phenylacetic acid catabolic protein [Candidatus Binataceae bacterium]|jgi:1,2-phenylacetyl-CoA epoxidase catalytic subunit
MPIRRQFAERAIEAPDIKRGRVEPQYVKVLTRLLAAHALAEKLTAQGYRRIIPSLENAAMRAAAEKNFEEENRHAALVYRVLAELGVDETAADRAMIAMRRSPSFEAARYFAEQAAGELDLVMASISLDMTGLIMIGVNYKESSYAPHCRAAEIILEEEAEHDLFAAGELSAAVRRFGAEALDGALREWLPRAVNFFGPPGSGFSYDCIRFGLKSKDNQELAELYLTLLERRLAKVGLQMPPLTPGYPHAIV